MEKPNSHANYGIPSSFNAQTKQADILKMRLKKAQLTLNIMSYILTINPDVTVPNKMSNNHVYNMARKAHDYLFKFHLLTESEEWNILIISPNVKVFIYQQVLELQKKYKELIIRKAAVLSIKALNGLVWYSFFPVQKKCKNRNNSATSDHIKTSNSALESSHRDVSNGGKIISLISIYHAIINAKHFL
ncbi:hypothetical protein RhiirA5_427386 [Rhizophagus irregularis]|uniref:Uncharacterized protein n=1 Tax=Rhizophagus irregularis TaxID=588596 RepID=A0A2N0P2I0_9GLOM|nr:hypothetical protein RhiirA5_427386 [Rhizophagus irregularis]